MKTKDQWSTCSCEEDSLILLNLDAAGVDRCDNTLTACQIISRTVK
jgi:hypothetical protein